MVWCRRKLKIQWLLTVTSLGIWGFYVYNGAKHKESIEMDKVDHFTTESHQTRSHRKLGKFVTKSLAQLGKMDEINKHFLLLNYIPRSGAEILIFILQRVQGMNNFRHIRMKGPIKGELTKSEQEKLVYDFYDIRKSAAIPLSFDKNVHFINFTTFDRQLPTYINLIRDPVEKVMTRVTKNHVENNIAIRCLLREGNYCKIKMEMAIPYFCGYSPRCMEPNNAWALKTAIENVEKYYPVVGVLEELNATLHVMEKQIPYFFKGAKDIYQRKLYILF
ncbi:uronyl 2-sulfotransferase-like isoform X2 [Cylas formicarius]|uniref:uronyl 2-sulfotransferase-like isoform X2 n=1 Tax=Cylas formicarius TaxID=197179 RepID=UPI0029587E77|nr:uronyl 2-sulfotransferase-like isoform X2 [Cylas formicarius]